MEPANETQVTEEIEEIAGPTPEQEEIRQWRLSQILSLGIEQLDAQLLAESGSDLGLLRRLVGQGCPPDLAARIVL